MQGHGQKFLQDGSNGFLHLDCGFLSFHRSSEHEQIPPEHSQFESKLLVSHGTPPLSSCCRRDTVGSFATSFKGLGCRTQLYIISLVTSPPATMLLNRQLLPVGLTGQQGAEWVSCPPLSLLGNL